MSQTPVKYSVGFSMPCSCRAKVETESEPKFEDCKDRVSGQLLLLLLLLPFKESMSSHLNLNSVPLKWNSDWVCVLCRNMYAAYWWETVEHIQFAKISQCARNKAIGHIAAWYWSVMGLFFFFSGFAVKMSCQVWEWTYVQSLNYSKSNQSLGKSIFSDISLKFTSKE